MSRLTVAYSITIVDYASMYSSHGINVVFKERITMLLRPRVQRNAVGLLNWTAWFTTKTVHQKQAIPFGAQFLVQRRNDVFFRKTSYRDEDILAWHVYIEGCQLKARPVWYKPPGRNTGMYLGADPVADVLDYYKRKGRQVLKALKGGNDDSYQD